MRNERAAGDTRHARTGKDGAFYNKDGVLLATVEQFTSNVNWSNAKYSVLGDAQEHETAVLTHRIPDTLYLADNGCSSVAVVVHLADQAVRGGIDSPDQLKTGLHQSIPLIWRQESRMRQRSMTRESVMC